MLLNGNVRTKEVYHDIQTQIYSNTINNVMNYDLYSQNEIKESLNTIENFSTQFSLWINDLEIQVSNAICSRSKEVKLESFNLNNFSSSSRVSCGKVFNNFEKLKIKGDEIEIDQEVEKYLRENKRAAIKRRKNFSLEDERNFIKKKPKENINKQIKPNENISNLTNVTDLNLTEIEARINCTDENFTGEYFSVNFDNNENISAPPNKSNLNTMFDTKPNSYLLSNQLYGLKDVIEEMPSKEEENFKFSLSCIEKKDSNIEMKEGRKSNSSSKPSNKHNECVDNLDNIVDPKEPVLEFNLNSLSVGKLIREKSSGLIPTYKNFISEDLVKHIENNPNILEPKEKSDEIYHAECNLQAYNMITSERVNLNPASKIGEAIVSNLDEIDQSKEKKIIFKSSNIKMNTNNSLNVIKQSNNINSTASNAGQTDHNLESTSTISADKNKNNIKPGTHADFTFYKEKPKHKTNSHASVAKIPIANDASNHGQVKTVVVISNTDEANADVKTTNINSNFLKDKDNLFNILFNYNESFSNLDESPAVEKWNPNKLESTSKKLGNFKNNFNNANSYVNLADNCSKTKIILNKVFKEKEDFGKPLIKEQNFSKQSKQIVTNHMATANQGSNNKNNPQNNFNICKPKIFGNSSQNFDSDKKFNLMNNITKTLSKKLIDPGYEITDQSCSSTDDKKDSDSDDKGNATPMFKSLKIVKNIPKWANDKKYISDRILYQKSKMDYKIIFGSCKVDDLNLNLIFTNSKREYNQPRGDSADWKLDNTISSHHQEDKNIEEGYYRNYYNSLDINQSNNKNTCGTNRKLLEVFNEINY